MKLRSLAISTAVVSFFFGIGLVLIPQTVVSSYGRELSVTGIYLARLLGAAFLGFGVITWLIRNVDPNPTTRALSLAIFVMDMSAAIISIAGQVSNPPVTNALGWTTVAIYLALGAGWGALYFFRPGKTVLREARTS
jgi:hypothetical protein